MVYAAASNTCQLPCTLVTCQNGGVCTNTPGTATTSPTASCSCIGLFTGTYCQTAIDYCSSSPCLQGGTCVSSPASFVCICPQGFGGAACSSKVPPASNPVDVDATFRVLNIEHPWYVQNYQFFIRQFQVFVAQQFGLNPNAVDVTRITKGSLIVQFTVTADSVDVAGNLVTNMKAFISGGKPLTSLAAVLPAAALSTGSASSVTVDPATSTAVQDEVGLSPGAAAGVFFAVLFGLFVLVVLGVLIARVVMKRGRAFWRSKRVLPPAGNYYEMNDHPEY